MTLPFLIHSSRNHEGSVACTPFAASNVFNDVILPRRRRSYILNGRARSWNPRRGLCVALCVCVSIIQSDEADTVVAVIVAGAGWSGLLAVGAAPHVTRFSWTRARSYASGRESRHDTKVVASVVGMHEQFVCCGKKAAGGSEIAPVLYVYYSDREHLDAEAAEGLLVNRYRQSTSVELELMLFSLG